MGGRGSFSPQNLFQFIHFIVKAVCNVCFRTGKDGKHLNSTLRKDKRSQLGNATVTLKMPPFSHTQILNRALRTPPFYSIECDGDS